jgi:hypothetical protein
MEPAQIGISKGGVSPETNVGQSYLAEAKVWHLAAPVADAEGNANSRSQPDMDVMG